MIKFGCGLSVALDIIYIQHWVYKLQSCIRNLFVWINSVSVITINLIYLLITKHFLTLEVCTLQKMPYKIQGQPKKQPRVQNLPKGQGILLDYWGQPPLRAWHYQDLLHFLWLYEQQHIFPRHTILCYNHQILLFLYLLSRIPKMITCKNNQNAMYDF